MGKIITCKNGREFERVSKWITIRETVITPLSSFYDYSENGNLTYFKHANRWYALAEFMRIQNADVEGFEFESRSEKGFICGVNVCRYAEGLYCEIDSAGERIRLYKNVM